MAGRPKSVGRYLSDYYTRYETLKVMNTPDYDTHGWGVAEVSNGTTMFLRYPIAGEVVSRIEHKPKMRRDYTRNYYYVTPWQEPRVEVSYEDGLIIMSKAMAAERGA